MDDNSHINPAQMALAMHGAVIALMRACIKHGLPLDMLLDEVRRSADVLMTEQAAPAAEVLRQLAESLESEFGSAPTRE